MKVYIVGDVSDKENINAFCSQLKESAIDLIALFPATDFMAKGTAVTSQLAVFWISSKTGDAIFNIANERNEKNLTTINYFAGPVALSDSQKNAIGRNISVFAELEPNSCINELVKLFDLSASSKSIHNTKTSLKEKSIVNDNLTEDYQKKQSIIGDLHSDSSTQENNTIPSSDENAELLEATQHNGKRSSLWMPWVWYVCSFLYDICITEEIITGWTNQSIWWLTITAVYFI